MLIACSSSVMPFGLPGVWPPVGQHGLPQGREIGWGARKLVAMQEEAVLMTSWSGVG